MLVTRDMTDHSELSYKAWAPMTTSWYDDNTGEFLTGVEPRMAMMMEYNYSHTEGGRTQTIPKWFTFPNFRRNAHSYNYIPVSYAQDHSIYDGITRQRTINVNSWTSSTSGCSVSNINWVTSREQIIDEHEITDNHHHSIITLYPMSPGYWDDDKTCTYESGLTDSTWCSERFRDASNVHNNYWFMYGDTTGEHDKLLWNPNKFKNNMSDLNLDSFHAVRMKTSAIYNSKDHGSHNVAAHLFYCPEFYMVWSTDKVVNPSCFEVGMEGFRSNSVYNWRRRVPSDAKPFSIGIRFKDASCTTGSNVNFQAHTTSSKSAAPDIVRTFGNDEFGSRIVNLGKFGDRYYYMAFVTAISAASRTGSTANSINNHLLGGRVNFNREAYDYWYYSMPTLSFETGDAGTERGVYRPTIIENFTNIRIHNFGIGFWGGNTFNLASTWGTAGSYDGWVIKAFCTDSPIYH